MRILTDEIQEKNVEMIFKEPQFDDWNLKKFASEYNLNILDLDPLWKDTSKSWYIENLKKNLENLEKIYD
jgi:ABC-type Zn uptake system ZnuABC Zn-binding protein ZnuA